MTEAGGANSLDWNALFWEPIRQNGERLAGILPNVINAFYVLAMGWAMAFVVQLVARRLLKFVRFDKIAEKTGISSALSESDISTGPTEWFSRLFFWIVMVAAIVKSLGELQMGAMAEGLDLFSGIVFQSLGLLGIFVMGLFMSVILSKIVYATAASLKVKSPGAYSRTLKWAILVLTILLVFRQISLPMNFVLLVAGAIFVSICIAFVIAFGVGGAGWAAKMLDRMSR